MYGNGRPYCGRIGDLKRQELREPALQVPAAETEQFKAFLDNLGYEYVEETGNPAYKLFLS